MGFKEFLRPREDNIIRLIMEQAAKTSTVKKIQAAVRIICTGEVVLIPPDLAGFNLMDIGYPSSVKIDYR